MASKRKKLPVATDIPSAPDPAERRKYEAEDALRTCEAYCKIKNDKGLMKEVKQLAKQKIKALNGI